MSSQVFKESKCFRPEMYSLRALPKRLIRRVQCEVVKSDLQLPFFSHTSMERIVDEGRKREPVVIGFG